MLSLVLANFANPIILEQNPEFATYTLDNARKFKIVSNFRATLTSYEFDAYAGSWDRTWNGEMEILKNEEKEIDLTNNGGLSWNGPKVLRIWYRNERGVFFREYILDHLDVGWVGPHPVNSETWDY